MEAQEFGSGFFVMCQTMMRVLHITVCSQKSLVYTEPSQYGHSEDCALASLLTQTLRTSRGERDNLTALNSHTPQQLPARSASPCLCSHKPIVFSGKLPRSLRKKTLREYGYGAWPGGRCRCNPLQLLSGWGMGHSRVQSSPHVRHKKIPSGLKA
jgi:hypothetical protein